MFEVQDFINESISFVHENWVKFYADSKLHVDEELLQSIYNNDVHYITVPMLLYLRLNDITTLFEVQCKCRSFSSEKTTSEALEKIQQDNPDKLDTFLDSFHDMKLA